MSSVYAAFHLCLTKRQHHIRTEVRDGSDLCPCAAILVARSPHWTMMTGPCAVKNPVATALLRLCPVQQEMVTPAAICRLYMLQNVRTNDPVATVYTTAEICHTCKAASWSQQFPLLAGFDVLSPFWLQQLDMQKLMFLSLIRSVQKLHMSRTSTATC
jgi:hypothetical protein